MQLLAEESHERGTERGLGLIPGAVTALGPDSWHIGWNTMDVVGDDPLFAESQGDSFYYNHSFAYDSPIAHEVGRSVASRPFAAAVRHGNVAGVQFHPEKSQDAGRRLLRRLIVGMVQEAPRG
jgi:glutamine amidotransferase